MTRAATAVYALTQQGVMTARHIAAAMEADVFMPPSLAATEGKDGRAIPFDSLRALIGETFSAYRQHIFISAAWVAVRCIAPYIKDRRIDPAIVVLDHHGRNVVSLLSGHLRGANGLAREVADIVGGQAIITTATDTENVPSLDILALEFNLAIANVRAVGKINEALAAGERVIVDDPENFLQLRGSAWQGLFLFTGTEAYAALSAGEAGTMPRVTVTPSIAVSPDHNLVLHPKVLHVGIDCRRGAKAPEILELITTSLAQLELSAGSVGSLAAPDAKRHESGLAEAAAHFSAPLRFFSAGELDAALPANAPAKTKTPPGNDDLCEAAALLAAGKDAVLRAPKVTARGIAIAVAKEAATAG